MPSNKPWLRLYSRLIYDPRVRTLDDDAFRLYIGLLCLASENKRRGYVELEEGVPWDPIILAQTCGLKNPPVCNALLGVLSALHLVTLLPTGVVWFRKWEELQYDKPSDRPEEVAKRVAKHRELSPSMPKHTKNCNADVTPVKRGCNAGESESDTDLKILKHTPHKEGFGEEGSIRLTAEEYGKLVTRFGESDAKARIQNLENYVLSHGKRYASHYRTILNWADGDRKKGEQPTTPKTSGIRYVDPMSAEALAALPEAPR